VVDFVQHLTVAVIVGLIWLQTPLQEAHINDHVGAMFFILVYNMFQSVFTSIFTFPLEKAVTTRERNSGSYRLSAYYLAKMFSSLPFLLLFPTLVVLIAYFMVGLKLEVGAFFIFLGVTYLCVWTAEGVAICISAAVAPNLRKAITILSVLVISYMLVGGFYVKQYPLWLAWIPWLSFIYPAVSAIIANEFEGTTWEHTPNATSPFTFENGTDTFPGNEIVGYLGVPFGEVGYWVLIVAAWGLFYRVLGFFILQYAMKTKK